MPVASTSAPLSTCSASVTVVNSTSNDMLNSFVFDSFVLPQNNIELAVELAFLVPTAVSPTCTIFTTCPSSTDCGTMTTSPLAAGVESPWNLTLPGCATDPPDHVLSDGVLDPSTRDSFVLPLQQLLVNSELTPELAHSPLAADVESPWNLTLPGCATDPQLTSEHLTEG